MVLQTLNIRLEVEATDNQTETDVDKVVTQLVKDITAHNLGSVQRATPTKAENTPDGVKRKTGGELAAGAIVIVILRTVVPQLIDLIKTLKSRNYTNNVVIELKIEEN